MYLFKHIYLLTKILIYFIESNSIMDLNKSPSMSIANSPPCSFTKSLAIARDLVKLQGGEFAIDIDGDLFKSIIEFDSIK